MGTAISQEQNIATIANSKVFPARVFSMGQTELLYAKENPNSPRATERSQSRYRTGRGRSSPYSARRAVRVFGEICGFNLICSKYCPGAKSAKTNVSTDTPKTRSSVWASLRARAES